MLFLPMSCIEIWLQCYNGCDLPDVSRDRCYILFQPPKVTSKLLATSSVKNRKREKEDEQEEEKVHIHRENDRKRNVKPKTKPDKLEKLEKLEKPEKLEKSSPDEDQEVSWFIICSFAFQPHLPSSHSHILAKKLFVLRKIRILISKIISGSGSRSEVRQDE